MCMFVLLWAGLPCYFVRIYVLTGWGAASGQLFPPAPLLAFWLGGRPVAPVPTVLRVLMGIEKSLSCLASAGHSHITINYGRCVDLKFYIFNLLLKFHAALGCVRFSKINLFPPPVYSLPSARRMGLRHLLALSHCLLPF